MKKVKRRNEAYVKVSESSKTRLLKKRYNDQTTNSSMMYKRRMDRKDTRREEWVGYEELLGKGGCWQQKQFRVVQTKLDPNVMPSTSASE